MINTSNALDGYPEAVIQRKLSTHPVPVSVSDNATATHEADHRDKMHAAQIRSDLHRSERIATLQHHLVQYWNLEDEREVKRVQFVEACNLPPPHRECFDYLDDERLAGVMIAVVPDEMWKKGSQPSESSAQNGLILMRESYFEGKDDIAWMAHELGHCQRYKDIEAQHQDTESERVSIDQEYQAESQTPAFVDIRSPYPYPNNLVEERAFKAQFRFLHRKGVQRAAILEMLRSEYPEPTGTEFFNRLLDSIYQ